MALSALDDKSREPNDAVLLGVLGRSKGLWDAILEYLQNQYPGTRCEWEFTSPKYGWILRPKLKKRTVLYMIPGKDSFGVSFVLGGKAVAAAEQSTLSDDVLEAIRSARQYAEGRGVRLEVKRKTDVENVRKLAEIKMAH